MRKKIFAMIMLVAATLVLGGCGSKADTASATSVVESLIQAYQNQDESTVKKCYGFQKEDPDQTTADEIDFNLNYYKAHEGKNVEVVSCDVLKEFDDISYVYAVYEFELESGAKAPYVITYLVQNKDGDYTVVPTANITADMSTQIEGEYEKFMDSDVFASYQENYGKFVEENPDYETGVYAKLQDVIVDGSGEGDGATAQETEAPAEETEAATEETK